MSGSGNVAMAPAAPILLSVERGVALITLNRPERLNSFNTTMHAALAETLDRIAEDATIRAVLLTGAGRGFCAGQDLADRIAAADGSPVDLGASIDRYYAPLIRRLATLPKPVVCAVNGVAAGAGANIALACDIVIAARSARFIQSFVKVGLIPDSGGTWILPRLVGQARALGLALTGDDLPAEKAARCGLIWDCVDDDALSDTALALATRLAAGPSQALAETKRLIRTAAVRTLDAQLEEERDVMRMLGRSDDYREGVAAFAARRKPAFGGT